MNKLKLLIVEDSEKDKETWEDSIKEFIDEKGLETDVEFCVSFEEANKRISNDFDAVIIDLRLEGDGDSSKETGGGRLITEKIGKLRLPTFVYTATPGLIDEIEKEETVFFKKYVKDQKPMVDVLGEIKRIYDTGITRILGGRGKIEELLNTIFWKHLSHSLDYWMKPPEGTDAEKALLRYIAAHLSEYLAIDQDGNFDEFFSPEFYLTPSIGENLYTGDVLLRKKETGNEYSVIINPSCDMVMRKGKNDSNTPSKRKAEKIVLASLIFWKEIEGLSGITEVSGKNKLNDLKNYVSNKNKGRFHYLPSYKEIKGMFIDFESIDSMEPELVGRDFERIATISPAFLRNIVARFSQYYSRQGQPDFNEDHQLCELLGLDKN